MPTADNNKPDMITVLAILSENLRFVYFRPDLERYRLASSRRNWSGISRISGLR